MISILKIEQSTRLVICDAETKTVLAAVQCSAGDELIVTSGASRWIRCRKCNGVGKIDGGYCDCAVGRDLERVEWGRSVAAKINGE